MLGKLEQLAERYEELNQLISDPEVIEDSERLQKYAKEHARLKKIVGKYRKYKKVLTELEEAEAMLDEGNLEPDFEELVRTEAEELREKKEAFEEEIPLLLIPRDPNDEKNAIMEIRAGTGGEEAALFAADLYRMYTRFAEGEGWKTETMNVNPTGVGGFKEIIFLIEGEGAFKRFKFESGVHRVQRVPKTESGGRIHTSTATVAVLPEVEEVEVDIDPSDLRIDTFRSSGPGGQSVNTTDSAVRITHEPTGVIVSCQDEKSQHKNKSKAMRILRARIKDKLEAEKSAAVDEQRKTQVGSGDRSERIRTYNFPQNRVTDHRIGLTLHQLEAVLDGQLEELISALQKEEQEKLLERVKN